MEVLIIKSQIEGEHKLKSVICVQISYQRLMISVLFCICTGLIGAFYFRWFPRKFIDFVYIPSTLEKATHVKTNPYDEVCIIQREGLKTWFIFRFLKYEFVVDQFKPLEFTPLNNHPLTAEQTKQQQKEYGFALMQIPIVGFLEFTLEELSTPFYTLQYICVVVWLIQGFFYFAVVMMSCSLLSTFVKFTLLRQSLNRLQSLAAIKQNVTVIRDDKDIIIDTNQLVPGDIIRLRNMIVPADCIINGMALLNEATLTGESNPVPKQNGQIIFEGTKIIECNSGSTGQVIRTNYSTIRGQYFRNVIYPHKVTHKFYTQAMKFLVGFVIFNIIVVAGTIVIYFDYSTQLLVANIISTLTWIFPPAMPIFFSLTATVALLKLKGKNVIGSNMDKIHISGQVDVVCFDKTGTLTTNELTVIELWKKQDCDMCISCCHHICQSEGELVGDVLDLEMFKFSQASIQFTQSDTLITNREKKIYKVIKIFDFNSELMMMSVIVECDSKYYFCSKGAPEKIQHKLRIQHEDITNQLSKFVNQGFRVISLVSKEITANEITLPREQLENNLEFLGYLVFENQLKNDTVSVIEQLTNSNLKVKILSGDNPLTTVNTAYNIGIAQDIIKLFDIKDDNILEIDIQKVDGKQNIKEQKLYKIDPHDLQNYIYTLDCKFALTGNFMEYSNNNLDVKSLYSKTVVFARVKPHQKKEVIIINQELNSCVAMIGDGSNDCSAISQADIGVSFSQADASYTANFSSLDQSISCVVTILAQGRATAQILSEIFPLYILLSFLATIAYTCLALEGQNYSDFQLIFLSFLGYLPIMASMALTNPLTTLSKELPLDDMFTCNIVYYLVNNQLSFYTHIAIFTGGLLTSIAIVMNSHEHHFDRPTPPISQYIRQGMLNSVTVIIAQVYSQFLPLILIISKPFKQSFTTNFCFCFYTGVYFIATIIFVFYKNSHSFLGLVDFNSEIEHFDVYLLLIMAGTIILDFLIQNIMQINFPRRRYL